MENQVDADRLHSFLVDHGSVYMTTVVLEIIVYVFFMCCHDISRFFPALLIGVLYDYANPNDVNYCPVTHEVSSLPFYYIPCIR